MNKKHLIIILILISALLFISPVNSKTVNLGGIDFNIPISFENEKKDSTFYSTTNNISYLSIESYILFPTLIEKYGICIDDSRDVFDKTINQRPVRIIKLIYSNSTLYTAFFPVNNTIYELRLSENLYNNLSNILNDLPSSNISKSDFNTILDVAYEEYLDDEDTSTNKSTTKIDNQESHKKYIIAYYISKNSKSKSNLKSK